MMESMAELKSFYPLENGQLSLDNTPSGPYIKIVKAGGKNGHFDEN